MQRTHGTTPSTLEALTSSDAVLSSIPTHQRGIRVKLARGSPEIGSWFLMCTTFWMLSAPQMPTEAMSTSPKPMSVFWLPTDQPLL